MRWVDFDCGGLPLSFLFVFVFFWFLFFFVLALFREMADQLRPYRTREQ